METYQLLLAALQDPKSSHLPCVFVVLGWLDQACSGNIITAKPAPIRDRLLDAAFRWVTQPRTQLDMQSFVTLKCACNPMEEPHRLAAHTRGFESFQRAARAAQGNGDMWHLEPHWHFICLLLAGFSSLLKNPRDAKDLNRPHSMLRRRKWPKSFVHILPHGSEDTLRGLLAWLAFNPGPKCSGTSSRSYHVLLAYPAHTWHHISPRRKHCCSTSLPLSML
jgi:hypothetical protein